MQYRLRFTASLGYDRLNLGVVLCPGHATLQNAPVVTERRDTVECARIGKTIVLVNQGEGISYEGRHTDGVALLALAEQVYWVGDDGLHMSVKV